MCQDIQNSNDTEPVTLIRICIGDPQQVQPTERCLRTFLHLLYLFTRQLRVNFRRSDVTVIRDTVRKHGPGGHHRLTHRAYTCYDRRRGSSRGV